MGMIDCEYHGYSVLSKVSEEVARCVEQREHPTTLRLRRVKIDLPEGGLAKIWADEKAIGEWIAAGLISENELRTTSEDNAATVFFSLGAVCGECFVQWFREQTPDGTE